MKKYLWWALAYTILVILWGAWVRISHSGDGCGASWPFCQGELIPNAATGKTWIEYTHRLMSGFYGILIAFLTFKVIKNPEANQNARFWMKMTLLFTITEALLGAKLVLFGLVGTNDSLYRAFVMALHFLNSCFLTGSLTMTALHFENTETHPQLENKQISASFSRFTKKLPAFLTLLFAVIGTTGTVAALANTLFPSNSILSGLAADLDPSSHPLIRLRISHPVIAMVFGVLLTLLFYFLSEMKESFSQKLCHIFFKLSLIVSAAVCLGAANILLPPHFALKLLHLLAAHLIWIYILQALFWLKAEQSKS